MNASNAGIVFLFCLLGAAPAVLAQSGSRTAPETHGFSWQSHAAEREEETASWYDGRLELGARIHHFTLKDTRRTGSNGRNNNNVRINFIGSVWGLDEIQDYAPRLYIQYRVIPYVGAGLTYDHVAAKTRDWGNVEQTRYGTDGDVHLWGPMLYLFARYPNSTRFTPMAEAGWVRYFADFDVNPAWAAIGPGYRFEVDDTDGYYLALALDYAINDHWHAQAYWRRLYDAEVDARAYFSPGSRVGRYGSFPMEYEMFGLGMSYGF
ncbi:MAG: hypothetical protein KBC66_05980 [Kiritimatiellae bacterium]|jgi:outer membrane protein W|nr:hypothetical protein [Kiritimatiellia bacterium]NLD90910.1 hypothetical protein [Lentisphaerota bacterium]HOU20972.1 hypothetical protein [Kiritimatiellia bacterium]HPC20649.1 hypothetical protein [Kiritimatiellia bacterium]HPC58594.1 hypothetical protein [Kiritimatiellia bacterium]